MAKKPKAVTPSRRPARAGSLTPASEKLQITVRQRLLTKKLFMIGGIFAAVLVICLVAVFLFYKVYADPQTVFWSMIRNNLTTNGVTRESITKSQGVTTDEILQTVYSPDIKLRDIKTVANSSQHTSLTLETIGTENGDYQHYRQIKKPGGDNAKYQKIYSLWLKNGGAGGVPQSVNDSLFGAVLFGNLDEAQRTKLMPLLKNSYKVNFAGVDTAHAGSRRVYIYRAVLSLKKYALAAQAYAKAEGLGAASLINPADYGDNDQLNITLTVDVLSRQVRRIDYPARGLSQKYSGYGLQANIQPPAHTVNAGQFENVVNSVLR
ncbi:MAG TPA: hypothetical protein VFP35_02880 [Candidatus Saccharimonadales bacterium]|nr:hypothetical protein [Candidatus Saccharimonadales bacterium]